MSAEVNNQAGRKLSVPFFLLVLSMLALLVSLLGLVRTSTLANERMADLQVAWQSVQDGTVEGSELVATDRQMSRLKLPVPAIRNAAWWSLGLAGLSCVLFGWLVINQRSSSRGHDTEESRQARQEQAALQRLLDEIAPLASGDLRVRATVSDSATGALAEAFNYAISELRWLVGTMGHAASCMHEVVKRSREAQAKVADTGHEQSAQTLASSKELSTLGGAMAAIAGEAADTSATAKQSLVRAEEGVASLASCLQKLSAVRHEAQSTTRLMHRLVDNVSAINDQVSAIREVARRTDLLALNTTIRASAGARSMSPANAASDLGRLSDEVSQLAEVLGQATRDIEALTMTIAQDAQDTVQAMELTGSEIDAGVSRTEEASVALRTIHEGAHALQQRAAMMAETTTRQTSVVRSLSEHMDAINHLTQQMTGEVVDEKAIGSLAEMAAELRQALSDYHMPPRPEPEGDHSPRHRVTDPHLIQGDRERNAIHG